MKYVSIAALSAVSLLALSACSSNTVKDTLGLDRAPPDEFRVVSRPPLYVPPQFNLRPPANSDASPNQLAADKKAQSLINGTDTGDANGSLKADTAIVPVSATDTAENTKPNKTKKKVASTSTPKSTATVADTGAESQFLKNVGADKADPHIRDVLTEEKYTTQEKQDDKAWWDVFSSDDKPDPIVDAKKESDRIQGNENSGKPVTTGDTPDVKVPEKGIFSGILGD